MMPDFLRRFIRTESAGGIVMVAFALLALIAANSGLSGWYDDFIAMPVTFGYGDHSATEPLAAWVKDILMVFFFLIAGMELKREICEGVLARRDQVILPLCAAIAGMAMPALIFVAVNHAHAANLPGWAIPSATDIAFALCVLTLAAKNIPSAAKIFLLAIAIFDDLGAIVIIAVFYNSALALVPSLLAIAGFGILFLLNRKNVTTLTPYLLTGVYLWFCLYHSGIHTTIAGVAVGMAIPMRDKTQSDRSPLNTCMHVLHPWVNFLILPLFAFTSAGISLAHMKPVDLLAPVPLGIAAGLFLGKQLGIFGMTWVLVRLRWVNKPEGTSWRQLYGISVIAAIGFTMSLFISLLAFSDPAMQESAKLGVISGSLISVLWGIIVLRRAY